MTDTISKAMALIERSRDPGELRQIAANARQKGELGVANAADLRLYEVLPSAKAGTLDHDVWRTVHALEGILTRERNRTTRLSRTRQMIDKYGEFETVRRLILKEQSSDGFAMLIDRGMPDWTFESVTQRHPYRFDHEVLTRASARLRDAVTLR